MVTRSDFAGPAPWRPAYAASDSHTQFFALQVDDALGLRVVSGRTTAVETPDGWEEHPELHTEGLHRGSDIRTVNGLWASSSTLDSHVILVGAEHYLGGVNPMGACPHCTAGFILTWDVRGE